jgi:hypothetical protein
MTFRVDLDDVAPAREDRGTLPHVEPQPIDWRPR